MRRTATPEPAPAPALPDPQASSRYVCERLEISRTTLHRLTKHDPIMQRAVVRVGPGCTRYLLPVVAEFQKARTGQRAAVPAAAMAARRPPTEAA